MQRGYEVENKGIIKKKKEIIDIILLIRYYYNFLDFL